MTRSFVLVLALSPLAPAAHAQISGETRVTMNGFGPVRVGMAVRQASEASGWELVEENHGPSENCWYAVVAADRGVRFMVEDGAISRIDIDDAHHRTASGIRIGDTERRARKVYGRAALISRHKYIVGGHYLTIRSRDRRYALVLETDGKNVTRIHGGRVPSAEYVEGCG